MEFGVLGPLHVTKRGRTVGVGSGKPRRLLAVLLAQPNYPAPALMVAGAVWDGDPPASAAVNLRTYVHYLRTAFGDNGRIVREDGGYQLVAAEDEIDAFRFQALAERGRSTSDPAAASELLAEALGLWRGDAYGDLAQLPGLREEAARLDELRLTVTGERIDLDLALGRHSQLVHELRTLVDRFPLRERFAAQLMLALHRCGRPADALEVYRGARKTLAEELGLDPGRELREIEQAILSDAPSLQLVTSAAPPVPAELPVATGGFTGRADELARLRAALGGKGPIVISAVDGAGGIGKSALAIQAAHEMAAEFPDGQLYVNLHGATPGVASLTPREVLGRFLRALGVHNASALHDTEEVAARFRSLTVRKRMLIVLDDAADSAQVRPLLPGGSGCAVLITSRRILATVDGAAHLHLGALASGEALTLLERLIGADRVATGHAAAQRIVRLCGWLPLGVRIAGARLAAHPDLSLEAFADRLEAAQLDELRFADLGVRASIAVSHQDLDGSPHGKDGGRLFALMGLLDPPDIALPIAGVLLGLDEERTRAALDCLTDAQLLETSRPDRYGMHDLIRLYAREQASERIPGPERDAAIRRTLHCYLATVRRVTLLLDASTAHRTRRGTAGELDHSGLGFSTREDAIAWIDAERANLVAVARQAAAMPGDGPSIAVGIAAALFRPFEMRAWPELNNLSQIALTSAEHTGDLHGQAQARNDLGWFRLLAGQANEAADELSGALAIWRQAGDPVGEAMTLNALGLTACDQERFGKAIDCFQRAIKLWQPLGDNAGEAGFWANLGNAHRAMGGLAEAIAAHEHALALLADSDDPRRRGITLGCLGRDYCLAGDQQRAIGYLEQAIELLQRVGGRFYEAVAVWHLGEALHGIGHVDAARQRWRQAITLLEEIGALTSEECTALMAAPRPGIPEPIRLRG